MRITDTCSGNVCSQVQDNGFGVKKDYLICSGGGQRCFSFYVTSFYLFFLFFEFGIASQFQIERKLGFFFVVLQHESCIWDGVVVKIFNLLKSKVNEK